MKLLEVLASGVPGAESGFAAIYRRGTSTPATVYSDFAGTTQLSDAPLPAGTVQLDGNGRRVVYVNQMCDVVVKNSSGTDLISFTAGEASPSVEVTSPSFTGADYVSGASGANKPTSLQAVMDLWKTTNGSVDWKVLINGSSLSIVSAILSLGGLFYHVEDPTYGAVGDGSTDDTAAIQAAITAAGNAGSGIVLFSAHTYKITSELTVPVGVSLIGMGSNSTLIRMAHGTNHTLLFNGVSAGEWQFVVGIGLHQSQSCSGNLMKDQTGRSPQVRVVGCEFGGTNSTGNLVVGVGDGEFLFEECWFTLNGGSSSWIACDNDIELTVRNCKFTTGALTAWNPSLGGIWLVTGTIEDNKFSVPAVTSGSYDGIQCHGAGVVNIVRNTFEEPSASSGTEVAMAIGTVGTNTDFYEDGNTVGASWDLYSFTVTTTQIHKRCHLGSRIGRVRNLGTVNTDPVVIPWDQYEHVWFNRTSGGGPDLSPNTAPLGCHGHLRLANNTGVAFTLVLVGTQIRGSGVLTGPAIDLATTTPNVGDTEVCTIDTYSTLNTDISTLRWRGTLHIDGA